jgi:hypothetical protein
LILPGKYYIYVDPVFNDYASTKYDFKKVSVDVYCQQKVHLTKERQEDGLKVLT